MWCELHFTSILKHEGLCGLCLGFIGLQSSSLKSTCGSKRVWSSQLCPALTLLWGQTPFNTSHLPSIHSISRSLSHSRPPHKPPLVNNSTLILSESEPDNRIESLLWTLGVIHHHSQTGGRKQGRGDCSNFKRDFAWQILDKKKNFIETDRGVEDRIGHFAH